MNNMSKSLDLHHAGMSGLRYALATNLIWIGALKFEQYETDNIEPLVTSSPAFSALRKKLGKAKLARCIGVIEIGLGTLIAAKPLSVRASAVGSIGAIGMFLTTLSFMTTTPGVSEEGHGPLKLSMVGQFLVKDSVLLATSMVTATDSLQELSR